MQSDTQIPYFSVVIPTYNRGHILLDAINAVLGQSFTDFEIIIVDDGSEDNTKSVIESVKDERLIYIWQENGERGKARNTGTKKASGKYVFFLDSDDQIESNHLQHAYDYLTINGEPEFFHIRYKEITGREEKPAPMLDESTLQRKITRQNLFACQFFLRRDIALRFPFSENRALKIGEDWQVILRIAARYPLHFSNEYLGKIIHGERSMAAPTFDAVIKSQNILIQELREDEAITSEILDNIIIEFNFLGALSAALEGKRTLAIKYWFKAFGKRPSILFKRRTLAIIKYLILGKK